MEPNGLALLCGRCGAAISGSPSSCPICGCEEFEVGNASTCATPPERTASGHPLVIVNRADRRPAEDDLGTIVAPTIPPPSLESTRSADSRDRLRPTPALPKEAFGDYELLGVLGRGGMGVVYRARQRSLDRVIALKVLLDNATDRERERFEREAATAARLRHPGIVAIHETGNVDGRRYFTMDLIEGEPLSAIIARGPIPPRRALEWARKVALSLDYAHRHGVVHRDVKPANILIDDQGEPRITDFGLARDIRADNLTRTGEVMGTPCYMAPEQATGELSKIDGRADVYALGAVLYEMLTGQKPFHGATIYECLSLSLTTDPTPPSEIRPGIHRDIQTICLKCLQKEIDRRYASAAALAHDIERYLEGEAILARPAGRLERLYRTLAKHRVATAAALAAFVVGASISIYALLGEIEDGRRRRAEHEAAMAEGRAAMQAGRYLEAQTAFARALSARPGEPGAENGMFLARAEAQRAQKERVRQEAERNKREDARRRAAEGDRLLAAGDFAGARENYLAAAALDPTLAEAHFGAARADAALERIEAARAAIAKEAEARAALGAAEEALARGEVEAARDGFARAFRGFEAALALDTANERAREGKQAAILGRADAALARGDGIEAREMVEYARELGSSPERIEPRERAVEDALGVGARQEALAEEGRDALRRGDLAAARRALEQAAALRPSPTLEAELRVVRFAQRLTAAKELAEGGDPAAALAEVESAAAEAEGPEERIAAAVVEREVRAEGHRRALAEAERLVAERKLEGAARACRTALSFVPGSAEAERMRARVHAEAGLPPGFVLVRGGAFPAGSAIEADRNPPRMAEVGAFYLGVREVTNAEWKAFLDAGGYEDRALFGEDGAPHLPRFVGRDGKPGPLGWSGGEPPAGEADRPVTGISFYEARAYAKWAGARLPTESEWEKAASFDDDARARRVYPWGADWNPIYGAFEVAAPRPAGGSPLDRSPSGCLDMGGNASEWTVAVLETPRGAGVLKGGCYCFASQRYARASWRSPLPGETRNEATGLRLALDAPRTPEDGAPCPAATVKAKAPR